MGYFTVYNYKLKDKDNLIVPHSVACFGKLYGMSVPQKQLTEVNIYLLYGEQKANYKHLMAHSKEEVIEFLGYFSNLFTQQLEVISISKNAFMNEMKDTAEDAEEAGFELNKTLKIHIPLKEDNLLYIKFVTTLVRFFYENEYSYKKIIDRFLKYRRYKKYSKIPSIELLQLCHSYYRTCGSHGFFSIYTHGDPIKVVPVKENIIIDRIKKGSLSLNNTFNCERKSCKYNNFTKLIQEYNESIRSRR